jgi:hypothetical protein
MASDETRQRVLGTWRSINSEQFRKAAPDERHRRMELYRQAREQWTNEVQEKLQQAAMP